MDRRIKYPLIALFLTSSGQALAQDLAGQALNDGHLEIQSVKTLPPTALYKNKEREGQGKRHTLIFQQSIVVGLPDGKKSTCLRSFATVGESVEVSTFCFEPK